MGLDVAICGCARDSMLACYRMFTTRLAFSLACVLAAGCGKSDRQPDTQARPNSPGSKVSIDAAPAVVGDGEHSRVGVSQSPIELLDAVGPLGMDTYDPHPVIAAVNAIQPLGQAEGTALLKAYLEERGASANDRGGLFAVLRVLYEPPNASKPPWPKDACTPRQSEFLSGPCLRMPRLGSPFPAAPEDLRSLRFPFFVLGDVPVSVVRGYELGGKAESLLMHHQALIDAKLGWLAKPLSPTPKETTYRLHHYGSWDKALSGAIDSQIKRLIAHSGQTTP